MGSGYPIIKACQTSCALCSSDAICSLCSTGYYKRPDTYCYTFCLQRQYANNISRTCIQCPYDCYSCKKNGECITCNETTDFRVLSPTTSRCMPLMGYYENFLTVSAQCPTGCSECSSSTFCTACEVGFLLTDNQLCADSCPLRFYPDYIIQRC